MLSFILIRILFIIPSYSPGNQVGAAFGTGYCDAQCPHDVKYINGEPNSQVKITMITMITMMTMMSQDWIPSDTDPNAGFGHFGSCCYELDIWEANEISTVFIAVTFVTVSSLLSFYEQEQN